MSHVFAPGHPANAGIVRHFNRPGRMRRAVPLPDCAPNQVQHPELNLGTHPDLVQRLWNELGGALPEDCRRVVYGSPMLVHPSTGVAFGFAGGTHTYGLRLPQAERNEALAAGAKLVVHYPAYPDLGIAASSFDVGELGPEWVLLGWFRGEEAWCRAAYGFAGEAGSGENRPDSV